jgi:hypothetical protein
LRISLRLVPTNTNSIAVANPIGIIAKVNVSHDHGSGSKTNSF